MIDPVSRFQTLPDCWRTSAYRKARLAHALVLWKPLSTSIYLTLPRADGQHRLGSGGSGQKEYWHGIL